MTKRLLLAVLAVAACDPVLVDSEPAPLRPDHPQFPETDPSFDLTETVESFVSAGGRVKIHFTRAGRNAVPARDDDTSGVPDYVELAARTYDEVRELYHGPLGLREPVSDALLGGSNDGGDDLFDVYLVDFAGRGDGAYHREACDSVRVGECTGFMLQENDFAGYNYPSLSYACRVLASHEYFHAVQSAYDSGQDSIFSESTAVWATERFDPTLQDFEGFIEAYLTNTDRPLNVVSGGVVDAKSYGTAIFFQFLSERYDPLIVPQLLEEVADGANGVPDPEWFSGLGPFFQRVYTTTFPEVLVEFAKWNLYTNARADAAKSYQFGFGYPLVTAEEIALPFSLTRPRIFNASARYFVAEPAGRSAVTAALAVSEADVAEAEGLELFIAALRGNRLDDPVSIADVRAGTEMVNIEGASRVFAAVVNTNQEGSSKRPNLCIGGVAEVQTCLQAVNPPADAGVEDAGGLEDSGVVEAPDAGVAMMNPNPEPEDDGGCSAIAESDALGLFVVAALLFAMRRRRG